MPRRALAQKRPYLLLSLVAAMAFYYLSASELPELYLIPLKGSACAFLAIYAWLRHGSKSARMLAGAMAVASLADMAMEMDIRFGGALFFVFHCIMLALFLRHRGKPLEGSDSLVFLALLLATPLAAYWLVSVPGVAVPAGIYGLALGAMAAGAWASDFPRFTVGAGAILFVMSDLLIFGGMGPLSGSPIPQYLVWPIYYLGQFLITVGIMTSLRKRDPELRVVQGGKDTVH
ncbi:lysoplasmalogenase [Erythrobacter arachoides]|uniref:Lysoplasmalogenase n=1 Tax=Aurantiacibacter arachoides TaxID=1850444 RepID=A0A845A0Q8_9SPHN|nr:lysoplasmalogenase family protein [Aurantiacibacter arachoides]MXO93130.1 lysoplasmalogenase [Aurantiacibacter arachoides]GGD51806.1 lysoplasmalogenase [Aurantiacibacter arachoides]